MAWGTLTARAVFRGVFEAVPERRGVTEAAPDRAGTAPGGGAARTRNVAGTGFTPNAFCPRPSLIRVVDGVSRDVAEDKVFRVYDFTWRWVRRDGHHSEPTGQRQVVM